MAGIYVHIPFCKQACYYCDFHFSTSMGSKQQLVAAIEQELAERSHYLKGAPIASVYFGGGTPSLLNEKELNGILDVIAKQYTLLPDCEITLEANPDDLTDEKLRSIKVAGVNRLSIGIQSFQAEDLDFMHRAHTGPMAESAVKRAQNNGFDNISVDLIYGIPTLGDAHWRDNILKAFELNVQHLSCYGLTIEEKTTFGHRIKKGLMPGLDDQKMVDQFNLLVELCRQHQFIHYEVSNFCKAEYYSKHNSGYWRKQLYLGVGPSAHSFDGHSRQWNINNNARYIKGIVTHLPVVEVEHLTPHDRYNEYVLTSLRTIWGTNAQEVKLLGPIYWDHFNHRVTAFLASGQVVEKEGVYTLSQQGILFADQITSTLFI